MKFTTNQTLNGKVVLAGAGPGDPDLITVKALRYIKEADVIITDRLVSQKLLNDNIKEGAVILYVGKQGGKEESKNIRASLSYILKIIKRVLGTLQQQG